MDCGRKCVTVFLDLKKAFDTVSVPILVHRLEKYGVRDAPLALFTSYLLNRKQQVKLGNYTSELANISYGVPQGSVLGPTLFLLYINELCNLKIPNAKIFSYADDTAIVFSGNTWAEVQKHAEEGLVMVAQWLSANLLTLNISKTNFICFTIDKRTQPASDFQIKIHNCGDPKHTTCSCQSIEKVTTVLPSTWEWFLISACHGIHMLIC